MPLSGSRKAGILINAHEGIRAMKSSSEASGLLIQLKREGENHICWTGLHQLSSSPGTAGFVELPGVGTLWITFGALYSPQLISGWCLPVLQNSVIRDMD